MVLTIWGMRLVVLFCSLLLLLPSSLLISGMEVIPGVELAVPAGAGRVLSTWRKLTTLAVSLEKVGEIPTGLNRYMPGKPLESSRGCSASNAPGCD